jgi:hypothetical protein
MTSPYTPGAAYWLLVVGRTQPLLAIVADVFEHELVLTHVRVHPEGQECYDRLIVGRAAVTEACQMAAAPPRPAER